MRRFEVERDGERWRIFACHTGDVALPWRAWATNGNRWIVADGQRLREAVETVERKIERGTE